MTIRCRIYGLDIECESDGDAKQQKEYEITKRVFPEHLVLLILLDA